MEFVIVIGVIAIILIFFDLKYVKPLEEKIMNHDHNSDI